MVASAYKGAIYVFWAGESGMTQRHTTQKDNFKLMKYLVLGWTVNSAGWLPAMVSDTPENMALELPFSTWILQKLLSQR